MNKNKYLKFLVLLITISGLYIGKLQEVDALSVSEYDTNLQKTIVTMRLNQQTSIWSNKKEENKDIIYYADNMKVASVDKWGNITAKMIGTTSVISVDKNNNKRETIVIVYRDRLEPLGEIKEPRYALNEEGIYTTKNEEENKSENKEDSNTANLMLVGDLMNQTRQQEAALTEDGTYDFSESFKFVKNIFSNADFVAGNLESLLSNSSPYMSEEKKLGNQPHCNGPATYLDALRDTGFDALMTSNNHIADNGKIGVYETLERLNEYKFANTGAFTSPDEKRYLIFDINGIKVAILSYSEKFNGKDVLIDEEYREYMINRYSKEAVQRDVKDAKEDGAEFIIAYNHWGVEYVNYHNQSQTLHAQEMADSGVDLIVGSHPHALQPSEVLDSSDGRQVPVIYSMGNFVSHQFKDVTKDTIILNVVLKKENGQVHISDMGYIPCHVLEEYNGDSYVVTPINEEFNEGVDVNSYYYQEIQESYQRIKAIFGYSLKEITSYSEIQNK